MHLACDKPNFEIMLFLLMHSSDYNVKNSKGFKPGENIIEARYMAYQSGRQYQIIDAVRCEFAYADGTTIAPQTYASLAREVVRRWMASPGHRENILNARMREHGFALAPNRDTSLCGGIFATQVLAR